MHPPSTSLNFHIQIFVGEKSEILRRRRQFGPIKYIEIISGLSIEIIKSGNEKTAAQ